MDKKEFWNRVKEALKNCGYTQRTLSSDMGLSERTIETWINQGTLPDAFQLYTMSKKLNVSMEYLVTGIEPDNYKTKYDTLFNQFVNFYAVSEQLKKSYEKFEGTVLEIIKPR